MELEDIRLRLFHRDLYHGVNGEEVTVDISDFKDLVKYLKNSGYITTEYMGVFVNNKVFIKLISVKRDESDLRSRVYLSDFINPNKSEVIKLFKWSVVNDCFLEEFFIILGLIYRGFSFSNSLKIITSGEGCGLPVFCGNLYNEVKSMDELDSRLGEILKPREFYIKNYNMLRFKFSEIVNSGFYSFMKKL